MSSERGGGRMRKFWTLLKKDLWASAQDKMVLMMFFCPIVLAILFRAAIYGPWLILMAVTVLNMVLAPLCTCPLLIAAEKEQGTLPLLRRSKVRGGEFIAAKSAAAVLTGIIAAVIIYLIAGEDRALLGEYLLLNAVIMISLLPYGLFIAVFARDQNSLNVYPIPGVLVFYVLPVFSMFHPLFGELARWVPTGLYSVIFRQTAPAEYNTFLDIPFFWSAIVCAVWFAGGIVILWLAVKKRDYLVSLESYK